MKPGGVAQGKGGRKRTTAIIILLLLILLLAVIGFLLYLFLHRDTVATGGTGSSAGSQHTGASISEVVAPIIVPASGDTVDSVPAVVKRIRRKSANAVDSSATAGTMSASADSAAGADQSLMQDSIAGESDPCSRDSVPPWVYPDPSGGLHRKTVRVKLVANKQCKIEWRWGGMSEWEVYNNTDITIDTTRSLEFRATDSCSKVMEPRIEQYEIKRSDDQHRCPADMEHITVGAMKYCIDRYEWPNRKGVRPTARVSLYQAKDSCMVAGKRLCTTEEWERACSGPYSWAYPYGERYEGHACVTADSSAAPAGSRPECRGYFEIFDMSGNLLEWTNTRAVANNAFNNVMGGFWESGSQSGCSSVRYSYYPQNRHNPVGFRCCRDTLSGSTTKK